MPMAIPLRKFNAFNGHLVIIIRLRRWLVVFMVAPFKNTGIVVVLISLPGWWLLVIAGTGCALICKQAAQFEKKQL
jgi:hypothetical protein